MFETQMAGTARRALRNRSAMYVPIKKKLQDSDRILQLNFVNSASLNLRLSHARPCDAPSVPCNTHELFGQLATALSQFGPPHSRCAQLCRERNSPGPAHP